MRISIALGLLLLFCCGSCAPPSIPARPNIVLITLDTVRADHLSCYGYQHSATPAVDRIAAEGLRFDLALSSSPWTLPAHASIFTGLAVSQHGARYDVRGSEGINLHRIRSLGPGPATLAQLLGEVGYHSAAAVGGVWMQPKFGVGRGFDRYEARIESWAGVPAEELTETAIELLDQRPVERPFLLFLNYFDAHLPYAPPPRFNPSGARLERTGAEIELDVNRKGAVLDSAERTQLHALYDAEIRRIDHSLDRLWRALEERGLYDETWIIVTADHGESFGEHRFFGHGLRVWHDVARVPLLMKAPASASWAKPRGRVVSEPVQTRMCFTTILEELGIGLPEHVSGSNLVGSDRSKEPIVVEAFRSYSAIKKFGAAFDRDERALYRGRHKLLRRSDGSLALFDVVADPAEEVDLAEREPERTEELADALANWTLHSGRPLFEGAPARIDRQDAERLRALGYLD